MFDVCQWLVLSLNALYLPIFIRTGRSAITKTERACFRCGQSLPESRYVDPKKFQPDGLFLIGCSAENWEQPVRPGICPVIGKVGCTVQDFSEELMIRLNPRWTLAGLLFLSSLCLAR